MTTDVVLIGSVLCVLGTVGVLAYFVIRGIQQIKRDEEAHRHGH